MTTWHKFKRGEQWVWAMESSIYGYEDTRTGQRYWTNVLSTSNGGRAFWTYGFGYGDATETGETATDVRLITMEEWQAGIHGHAGEQWERTAHCWEGGPETEDGCSTTCMLMELHEGPHEWTRDDQIEVSFPTEEG